MVFLLIYIAKIFTFTAWVFAAKLAQFANQEASACIHNTIDRQSYAMPAVRPNFA
jgi:hypothetical protein